MAVKPSFTATAEQALRDLKRLLDEGQFAEASRLCLQAIRTFVNINAFYRAKCYCDLQLRRWHSCLETVRWLHNFVEHPSIADVGNKRCPKRMRTEARELRAKEHADLADVLREAAGQHIVNGECQWLHFEQAYCYYKLGHFEPALTALRMCASDERPRDLHGYSSGPSADSATDSEVILDETLSPKYNFLLAQVYVRLGRFEAARSIYSDAQSAIEDPLIALNSLSTNLNLVAYLDRDSKDAVFSAINRDIDDKCGQVDTLSYEYCYNWAIAKLLEGDFPSSEKYLDLSEESLSAELRNDLGDSPAIRNQPEFMALDALRVFLLHKRGCDELAQNRNQLLMSTFGDQDAIDPGTMLIMLNNCLCLRQDCDESSLSKLETLLKRRNVVCKFARQELLDAHRNIMAHLLTKGDTAGCRAHIRKFMDRFRPDETLSHSLACVDYAEGKIDASITTLKRGLAANPGSILLIRSLLNVLLAARRFKSVLRTLQQFESILKQKDAINLYWSTLLQCHISTANCEGVVSAIFRLVECPMSPESVHVLNRGCHFLESHGLHAEALSVYQSLFQRDPSSISAYCGILFNQSYLPLKGASVDIPAFVSDHLFKDLRFIDAEELESEGQLTYVQQVVEVRKPHKSRKRRRYHPVDTSRGPPDPERWLPKYERSAFKKQLKRKKEMVKGHSQGATVDSGASKPTSGTIHTESAQLRRRRNKKK
ncbi:signal recognition particle subunit SRP72 [Babesia ovis]|uniref:Signal recognition particle subunit SRP72 n=1 Tax=Babesia ovis TaxID=5869 RepID=A0A9W5TD83_BABOV|nr:signal recognition particle subunit SRP72 [Babesia ovis]